MNLKNSNASIIFKFYKEKILFSSKYFYIDCGTPANVYLMFMIDGSGSVNSTEFTKIKEWINGISKKANLDKTTFGVIQFASK